MLTKFYVKKDKVKYVKKYYVLKNQIKPKYLPTRKGKYLNPLFNGK